MFVLNSLPGKPGCAGGSSGSFTFIWPGSPIAMSYPVPFFFFFFGVSASSVTHISRRRSSPVMKVKQLILV